ncbi:GNAT family N-acetyltransferase [Cystobacter fuscus]|uniref:GNAT family N-acetyltransferase n=1 Tax=Cystobacter fuscus TaxID=43 RepID=UPI002B31C04E|nr:GNAT family N-acetyltransferase [Cystobacter fuscus]
MEARQLTPSPRVVEVTDRAAFMALEPEWNALVQATADEPFYRHEFFRIWIDDFAPEARLRVLTLRDGEGRLTAVLPLMAERASLYGVPARQLSATANPHSCRFDLVAREPAEAAAAFFAHLRADKGWDVLRLTDVPEGGAGWHLYEAAKGAGMPVGTWESLQSPYIPLPATWEAYQASLSSKFKANCRRRRRKLEEKGRVTVERVEGGLDLEAKLEEGFALEASGWKGQRGTAMAQDGRTRGFYSELARTAAYDGRLALYYLRLDGRAVAFQYSLEYGGRYFLLKPGYDETLGDCSPGQLLMEEVLRECIGRGLREFDFLGPDMSWKRDWTDQVRRHTWLYVFNDSAFGRALCAAKFRWAPAAREVMARWKR